VAGSFVSAGVVIDKAVAAVVIFVSQLDNIVARRNKIAPKANILLDLPFVKFRIKLPNLQYQDKNRVNQLLSITKATIPLTREIPWRHIQPAKHASSNGWDIRHSSIFVLLGIRTIVFPL
jgi:hypothetical protein